MKKDSGKSGSQPRRSSKDGFILERRQSVGSDRSDNNLDRRNNARRPLSVEAFQESVSRYCRRFQKDHRDFSLSSVTVLEYKKASAHEKELLDKAIVSVLFKFLREEDRICFVQPAHYLVLMPSTTFDNAVIAMRRIAEKIGETKVKRKTTVLHPSAFASVTSVSKAILGLDNPSESIVDSEMLYSSIGYTIDSKDQIACLRDKEEEHQEPLFRGHEDGWIQRYCSQNEEGKSGRTLMRDLWTNNFVEMRSLRVFDKPGDCTTNGAYTGNLLRRLRVLQNLDLSGVVKLNDFYLNRDGILLLITCPPKGIELTSDGFDNLKQSLPFLIDAEVLSLWLGQILTSLIGLQTLVPPVIPKSFDSIRLYCCPEMDAKPGGQIVMSDYDFDYLQSAVAGSLDGRVSAPEDNESGGFLNGLLSFMVGIAKSSEGSNLATFVTFIENLDPAARSSPFKIRAQLKHLMEDDHA